MYLREYRDTMFWSAFAEEPAALLERAAGEPGIVASVPFTLRPADYFRDQYEGYPLSEVEDMAQPGAGSGDTRPASVAAAYNRDVDRLAEAMAADSRVWIDERLPVPPPTFWWEDWMVVPWRERRYFRLWHPSLNLPPPQEREVPGC